VERLDACVFGQLNRVVTPLVRSGVGSPGPWPTGAVVVETTGRTSGRPIDVPLLATLVGDLVVVSTVRRGSQWVQNLIHTPQVRYWMHGRPRAARALVIGQGIADTAPADTPPLARWLAAVLAPGAQWLGIAFAILIPAPAAGD
jgi:hypothetical protein